MEASSNNESSMCQGDVVPPVHKRHARSSLFLAVPERRNKSSASVRRGSSLLYERGRYEASNAHIAIESTDLAFVSRLYVYLS